MRAFPVVPWAVVVALPGLLTGCSAGKPEDTSEPVADRPIVVTDPGTALTWFAEIGVLDAQRIVAIDERQAIYEEIPIWQELPEGWAEAGNPTPLLMDFQLLPEGHILLTLANYGLQELDADRNVVWEYLDPEASHDADRLPDGNTLFAHGFAAKGEPQVVEIDPEGNVVWTWTGLEAYENDPRFAEVELDGWVHVDGVARNPDGTTMICARNFNAILDMNPDGSVAKEYTFESSRRSETAFTDGQIEGTHPHAAEHLSDGTTLIGLRYPSRAVRIAPDGSLAWEWTGDDMVGVKDIDILADGNVLISSRDIVEELDAAGTSLWKWVRPDPAVPGEDGTKAAHAFNVVVRTLEDGTTFDKD